MKKIIESDTCTYPFEQILIDAYDNQDNKEWLDAMMQYVSKNRSDYPLVALYTLKHTLKGYYDQ